LRDAFEEPADLFRVQAHVADRPGILAAIMQALGAERINIEDLELHHVSRERGGTLALLISGEDAAHRAADVLAAQGYDVDITPELG
jgi:predicted amino acid-binding ACT domain protein